MCTRLDYASSCLEHGELRPVQIAQRGSGGDIAIWDSATPNTFKLMSWGALLICVMTPELFYFISFSTLQDTLRE